MHWKLTVLIYILWSRPYVAKEVQAVLGKTFENIANFFAKNTVQWGMQRNDQARSWWSYLEDLWVWFEVPYYHTGSLCIMWILKPVTWNLLQLKLSQSTKLTQIPFHLKDECGCQVDVRDVYYVPKMSTKRTCKKSMSNICFIWFVEGLC